MARPLGSPKLGGRKKGTPNKDKGSLYDRLQVKFPGLCPIEVMCQTILTTEDEGYKIQCCKEVAQYLYPKLKTIDHNHGGQADNPIKANLDVRFIKSNVKA